MLFNKKSIAFVWMLINIQCIANKYTMPFYSIYTIFVFYLFLEGLCDTDIIASDILAHQN